MFNYVVMKNFVQDGGYFLLIFFNGVRMSPLGTAATVWRIVPAPDDR